jgi:hypothetical protein
MTDKSSLPPTPPMDPRVLAAFREARTFIKRSFPAIDRDKSVAGIDRYTTSICSIAEYIAYQEGFTTLATFREYIADLVTTFHYSEDDAR